MATKNARPADLRPATPTDAERGAPNWRRTLYISAAVQTITLVGFSSVFPFLPLYIQSLGVTGGAVLVWSGVIGFVGGLCMALMSPIWGTLGDRFGRKPMVVRALLGGALTTAGLIVAPTVWVVLVLRILGGILTGSVAPAQALVAAAAPRDRMAYSMGMMGSALFLGTAIGPFAGGLLTDRLGFRGAFAVAATLLALSAALMIGFVKERFVPPPAGSRKGPFADLVRVAAMPGLGIMALVLFISAVANALPSPVLPLLVPELRGVPVSGGVPQVSTVVGLIFAASGISGAIASWRAAHLAERWGYRRTLVAAIAGAALLSAPAAFADAVWQLVVLRGVAGFCLGATVPVASALIGLITPTERRGAAFGLVASAEVFGFASGPLLGGAVGAAVGLRPVFLTSATILFALAAAIALLVREPQPEHAAIPAPAD